MEKMNRLTDDINPCFVLCCEEERKLCNIRKKDLQCLNAKRYKKLAAYEDTELESEEVQDLKDCIEGEEGTEGTVEDLLELMRYRKLEAEGRLIKLPCKEGDIVYLLGGKDYNEFRVSCVDWKCGINNKGKCYQLYLEDSYDDRAYRNFSDIGKTVFLTKEEAVKALEGKTDEQN